MKYVGLYPHGSVFLGNKVTQAQISVMKVIISSWLASKSKFGEFYSSLSDFVNSLPAFCIYHYKVHGFEGPGAQDSYCFFFFSIKCVILESKGISWEVIICGRSRDPESKTVESFNSTIG